MVTYTSGDCASLTVINGGLFEAKLCASLTKMVPSHGDSIPRMGAFLAVFCTGQDMKVY